MPRKFDGPHLAPIDGVHHIAGLKLGRWQEDLTVRSMIVPSLPLH
jgi:hypothetical protein